MDAIDKMIAVLTQEAAAQRQQLATKERAAIQADHVAAWAKKSAEIKQRALQAQQQLAKKYQQEIDRKQTALKQARLLQQNEYLNKLYQEANQVMQAWSSAQVQRFATDVLQQLPLQGHVACQVGVNQAEALTETWLAHCQETLPYTVTMGPLLEEDGFLINDHGVQYNFSYRLLIEEAKETTREYWRQQIETGG